LKVSPNYLTLEIEELRNCENVGEYQEKICGVLDRVNFLDGIPYRYHHPDDVKALNRRSRGIVFNFFAKVNKNLKTKKLNHSDQNLKN
jgi:hypothetical protein